MGRYPRHKPPPPGYRSNPGQHGMSDSRYLELAYVVGGRIRRLRLDREWRLSDLAGRVRKPETGGSYSASYLSRLERGWANAPLYVYLRIAAALEVDEWLLFARDDVAEQASGAEMVIIRFLRETGMAPEQALARLVSPR